MAKISQTEIKYQLRKIVEDSLIETFNYDVTPELKIKINNIANDVLSTYYPKKYKRRNNGLGYINNIEVTYSIKGNMFSYDWRDTTQPNHSVKNEEWMGTDENGNEYGLAELISGITYDGNGKIESESGLIPNIFNKRTDYEWAEPNYRPYIQTVNEYLDSDEFMNFFMSKLVIRFSKKFKTFLRQIRKNK